MIQAGQNKIDNKIDREDPDFKLRQIYRHYTGTLWILLGFGYIDSDKGGEVELGDTAEQIILSEVTTGKVVIRPMNRFFDRNPSSGQLRYTPIDVIQTREV